MEQLWSVAWELILMLFVENAAITIPIAISVLAVIISVATARQQNAIALFELRYKSYSQLRTIRSFDTSIHDCEDPNLVLKMFDALWGTSIAKVSGEESLIRARCHMEIIVHDVLSREFLFRHKFDVDFAEILKNTQEILIAATSGQVNMDAQKELHRLCELFEKKDLQYMCRKLKL